MKNCHRFQSSHAIEAYSASRDLWDTPIFESRSFVAVPTVGALVEGWLLIVPKEPVLSFSRLSTPLFSEFEHFLKDVAAAVESAYGSVSVFEHGPSFSSSPVGCGVDYAHMHVIPSLCDLLGGAIRIAPDIEWQEAASVRNVRGYAGCTSGYWFVQQKHGSGDCYIGTCSQGKPMSQLFRRVIANHVGSPEGHDWKFAAGETLIAVTVEKLTGRVAFA